MAFLVLCTLTFDNALAARFIGVKSPIPYRWRNVGIKHLKYGMNFAYGGTGVFDTLAPEPNMTTQIDFFQQMINDKIYSTVDLQSSVALVSLSGNDYSTYVARNGSAQVRCMFCFFSPLLNWVWIIIKIHTHAWILTQYIRIVGYIDVSKCCISFFTKKKSQFGLYDCDPYGHSCLIHHGLQHMYVPV